MLASPQSWLTFVMGKNWLWISYMDVAESSMTLKLMTYSLS